MKWWYLSCFKTKKAYYLYCWRNLRSQSIPHPMCHVPDRHRTYKTRYSQTLLMLRSAGPRTYDLPGGNLMRSARCLELMRNSLTWACIWAESHFYSTTKSNEPWNQSKTPLSGPVTVCVWCEYQCGSFCSGPFATVQMDPQIMTVKATAKFYKNYKTFKCKPDEIIIIIAQLVNETLRCMQVSRHSCYYIVLFPCNHNETVRHQKGNKSTQSSPYDMRASLLKPYDSYVWETNEMWCYLLTILTSSSHRVHDRVTSFQWFSWFIHSFN